MIQDFADWHEACQQKACEIVGDLARLFSSSAVLEDHAYRSGH